ncbi:MAG: chlorite dismutase family protein [Actinomycetota bacterium]
MVTLFHGGRRGSWHVERIDAVKGASLPPAERLEVVEGRDADARDAAWTLRGITSYERYVRRDEQDELRARSPELERPEATRAALIPVRKSDAWWNLPQDERREVFEERSRHIATGLKYLPAVARRLYHCRDLGEPFDFLTWFEYAPTDAAAFEELVAMLRKTEEWGYVEREVDIRLARDKE